MPSPARENCEEKRRGAGRAVRNTGRETSARLRVPTSFRRDGARGEEVGERASHLVGLAGNVDDAVVQGGRSRCEDGADEVGAEGEEEESDTPARTPTGLVVGHDGRDRRLCVGATSTVSGDARGAVYRARGGAPRDPRRPANYRGSARADLTSLCRRVSDSSPQDASVGDVRCRGPPASCRRDSRLWRATSCKPRSANSKPRESARVHVEARSR